MKMPFYVMFGGGGLSYGSSAPVIPYFSMSAFITSSYNPNSDLSISIPQNIGNRFKIGRDWYISPPSHDTCIGRSKKKWKKIWSCGWYYCYWWHVARDMWHVTGDMWHVTGGTWHVTNSVGWTLSQNFSTLALPVWDWECLDDILTKGSLTESMNQLLTEVIVEQPQLHRVC